MAKIFIRWGIANHSHISCYTPNIQASDTIGLRVFVFGRIMAAAKNNIIFEDFSNGKEYARQQKNS